MLLKQVRHFPLLLQVKVVPTTPERLHRPLGQVLATPEPRVRNRWKVVPPLMCAPPVIGYTLGWGCMHLWQCIRWLTPVLSAGPLVCLQWDQPVPGDWEAGGGWGQQPTVLMAGLE